MRRRGALVAATLLVAVLLPSEAGAQAGVWGRRVVAVEVETPAAELLEAARAAIVQQVQQPYSVEAVRESIQNLIALGSVANVDVLATERSDGLRLVFRLHPALTLRRVVFTGDRAWSEGRMRGAMPLRDGMTLDDAVAARLAGALQRALSDDGYELAAIGTRVAADAERREATLYLHVRAGSRTRLANLTFEGSLGVARIVAESTFGVRPGDWYRPAQVEAAIRRLHRTLVQQHRFFATVQVAEQTLDLQHNTMDLHIAIDAGPRVALAISGIDRPEHELHDLLAVFEFGTVDDWALKETRRQLIRHLQQRGHWRPLVSYSRARDAQGRNIDVRFRVLRGDRASLVRIAFDGNASVPANELLASMRLQPSAFLRNRRFVTEWWEEDQRAVVTTYRRNGFAAARVADARVHVDEERGGVVATLRIDEGERTVVAALDLEPTSAHDPGFDAAELAARLEQQAGGPYDAGAVRRDVGRLRALLADRGYPRAVVSQETALTPAGARIVYRIAPGERVHVARVLIGGNEDTDTEVIRRELAFVPGSHYSLSDLLESQTRLYRLGLFSQVDVEPTIPDRLGDRRSLVVRVREAPPMFITYGAGFDTEEKLRGTLAIGHNNIGGRNRQLTLSTRASVREQRVRLLFAEPWLLGRPLEATGSAFYTDEDKPSFDVRRIGASVQVRWNHGPTAAGIARFSFRRVDAFDIQIDPALIRREDQSTRVGSLGYILVQDSRDDPIDPGSGSYSTADVELAARALGSATDFATLFGRSFWYRRLSPGVVLAAAARGGIKLPFAGSESVPLPERFFAGGSTTLRGFALDRAGPVDARGNALGGEVLLVANVELRARLRGALGMVAFLDVGNVFAEPRALRWSNVRESVGLGLRYDTPVGPVRLDAARLLDRRAGEDRYQLFFSVGHTF